MIPEPRVLPAGAGAVPVPALNRPRAGCDGICCSAGAQTL